jgi:hypothetical protein
MLADRWRAAVKFRSLLFAAAALLVGINIGFFLQSKPPEVKPPGAPGPVSGPVASGAIVESASKRLPNGTPSAATEERRAHTAPVTATAARSDGSETPHASRSLTSLRADDGSKQREYRDDTFGPDEPGLPLYLPIDEEGAAEDFERFGDGPVRRSMPEVEGRPAGEQATEELDVEPEGCLAPLSRCRQDVDCCGTSVCRSRPGAISGHFECTPR